MFYEDKKKRHFRSRRNKVNNKIIYHPNYIVGESETEFYSFGLTHSKKLNKKHNNYMLKLNPNKKDDKPSYLRKNLVYDKKKNYSKIKLNNYHMSNEDNNYIDFLLEKYKKKR